MSTTAPASERSRQARQKLKRRGLLFVQLGTVFDPLRDDFISHLGGQRISAAQLCEADRGELPEGGILVVTEFEAMTSVGRGTVHPLGVVRKLVGELMEKGVDVCLVSRSPKIAFPTVPGSSIVEDATVFFLPLLTREECDALGGSETPGDLLPAVSIGKSECAHVFHKALGELGVATLAGLDHALYEAGTKSDQFTDHLDAAQREALRGAGLLQISDEGLHSFAVSNRIIEFREAVAHALADVVEPQNDFRDVADGLWTIERMIRRALRAAAIEQHQARWRKQVANHGDLASKLLERAKSDAYLTAQTVAELRDPIEWMSLGELLEVIGSRNYGGLGINDYTWRRFAFEILPVRNRLSHMRLIKGQDLATIKVWVAWIKRLLD
jgi:hypothetical protein